MRYALYTQLRPKIRITLVFDINHARCCTVLIMLELCKCCNDSRLRSATSLSRGCVCALQTYPSHVHSNAGPKVWKALPSRLRSSTSKDTFCGHLETHVLPNLLTKLLY